MLSCTGEQLLKWFVFCGGVDGGGVTGWLPLLSCRNTDNGIRRASLHLLLLKFLVSKSHRLLSPFRLFLVKTSQYIANFHPGGL